MSLITLFLLIIVILIFRCQYTQCTSDNLPQILADTFRRVFSYIVDVASYSVKRFTDINWRDAPPTPSTPPTPL